MTSRAALGWPGEPPGADVVLPADALATAGEVPGWLVIADELPDGLGVADETGQVTVFNTAAAQLTRGVPAGRRGGVVRGRCRARAAPPPRRAAAAGLAARRRAAGPAGAQPGRPGLD